MGDLSVMKWDVEGEHVPAAIFTLPNVCIPTPVQRKAS